VEAGFGGVHAVGSGTGLVTGGAAGTVVHRSGLTTVMGGPGGAAATATPLSAATLAALAVVGNANVVPLSAGVEDADHGDGGAATGKSGGGGVLSPGATLDRNGGAVAVAAGATRNATPSAQLRYCKTCRCTKPLRTHHCHICKRCVLKMGEQACG